MKIAVELRQLIVGRSGGVVPLVVGVLEEAWQRYPNHVFHLYCVPENEDLFPKRPSNVGKTVLSAENYFLDLDIKLLDSPADVLFRSFPMSAPLVFPAHRQIFLVPDLQHEFFPDFFTPEVLHARRESFGAALREGGAIATLSNHALQSIRVHPRTRCRDVFLMAPAVTPSRAVPLEDLTARERSELPRGEYFLFPGNLWPHKNHRRTLKAFALFLERTGRDVELVLTGDPAGLPVLLREFPKLPVRHLGFVRSEFVRFLLEHALALLFFSLYEGFGIPLLEAFDARTPVLCSNTTSLPEVGQDAVLTCDPTDVLAMRDLMLGVYSDAAVRERLVSAGTRRLEAYSWARSAQSLVEACHRVAERAGPRPGRAPLRVTARLRARQLLRRRWAALRKVVRKIVRPEFIRRRRG